VFRRTSKICSISQSPKVILLRHINAGSLAALMRRQSDAFPTGPMDLGYCDVLEYDIDTGDAEPI